jgi:penicillin-binding protein 1A
MHDTSPTHARRRARLLRWLLRATAFAALTAIAAAAVFVIRVWPTAPGLPQLRELQAAKPSVLMSADGKVLTAYVRAQQEPVSLAQVSPQVVRALLATEDHRFYEHRGVDLPRAAAALVHTLAGDTQGGSTLTQQLARNLFPQEIGRARTLTRKLREAITALRIERAFSKEEILQTYLNTAPFLYNVVGIEMAARTYYDKPAAELNELESATLIGMLKGTRYYNPVLNPERALERRNVVLAQMVRHGMLQPARYEELRRMPLKVGLYRPAEPLGPAPHFAVHVRRWLSTWAQQHGYDLYRDGLVVQTTLDTRLQEAALRAVGSQAQALQAIADVEWSARSLRVASRSPGAYLRARAETEPFAHFWSSQPGLVAQFVRESPRFRELLSAGRSETEALHSLLDDSAFVARLKLDKTRLETGLVAMEPATGQVKAWVGSRDFAVDQYDHVAQAVRQPGSTFKPIVYGAALMAGYSEDRIYWDEPVELPLADGTVWRPTDMNGSTGMPMTMRDGLVHSRNTITAQVAHELGVQPIVSLARALGIERSPLDPVPSLALGTSPVSLLEMASAYATIAEQGLHHPPLTVTRITDRQGHVLAEFGAEPRRAMPSDAAVDLIDMMRGVVQEGTGTQVRSRFGLRGDLAGKTGTSQNYADGWFILMHPQLVTAAWVGFNDARVTMRSGHWGQGGHNAVLLVGEFFRSVLQQGQIDGSARFPAPRHPPSQQLPWVETYEERLQREPPGSVVDEDTAVPQDAEGIVIGNKASITTSRPADAPPKSAEELGQAMRRMGRDPETGVPILRSELERPTQ